MLKRSLSLIVFLLTISPLFAQNMDYINLLNRANTPRIFIDDFVYPTEDGKSNLSIFFRFDNDFLPFKKITPSDKITPPQGYQFYTITRLNSEIFEGQGKKRNSNNIAVSSRDVWIDTLYTKTFEETESKEQYASGSLTNTLEQGNYHYVLQLSLMDNTNERNSSRNEVYIPNWEEKKTGEIVYVSSVNESDTGTVLPLMNLEDNVYFGKDFYAVVRIPQYSASENYTVQVSKARIGRRDTTAGESVYTSQIKDSEIHTNSYLQLKHGKDPSFDLKSGSNFTYAIVKLPNSTFDNSAYLLELKRSGSEESLAKKTFRSYWQNMPASLYSLEVSIDMMKYIISENQLKDLKSGDRKEKETKFREFWSSKDPTPNTVYNELMAEYYRRIDYSFKEFSNRGNYAGHESDQGQVYIKYGPPESKERRFPTDGKVLEVWNYPNRTFVFEASTGFGDFVLLGTE